MTRNGQPPAMGKNKMGLNLPNVPEQDRDRATAKALSMPEVRAASIIQRFDDNLDLTSLAHELKTQTEAIQAGDMGRPEAMLSAQAHTLDALFSNLARRAQANMTAGYEDAAERYLRLALKAQAQSLRTIEALAELKAPKAIQFIGQANIAQGHQQINNASRAEENQTEQSKLSTGESNDLLPDTRTPSFTGAAHQTVEAVGAVHRAEDSRG